jgi:IS30 family transposase
MTTSIFTTKKLEKIISLKVENKNIEADDLLGKWNASVFYIAKKKCLIFVNSKTFFTVVIPKFSTTQIKDIDKLFFENLKSQLIYEKIEMNFNELKTQIGKINFHPTDNDRKLNGIINYNISIFDYMKYEFEVYNSEVIREITKRLNLTPFKQLNWKQPKEMMIEMMKQASV